jgi:hypothetical protein
MPVIPLARGIHLGKYKPVEAWGVLPEQDFRE